MDRGDEDVSKSKYNCVHMARWVPFLRSTQVTQKPKPHFQDQICKGIQAPMDAEWELDI